MENKFRRKVEFFGFAVLIFALISMINTQGALRFAQASTGGTSGDAGTPLSDNTLGTGGDSAGTPTTPQSGGDSSTPNVTNSSKILPPPPDNGTVVQNNTKNETDISKLPVVFYFNDTLDPVIYSSNLTT